MTDRNPMQMALALVDFYRSTQAMTGLSGTALQTHKIRCSLVWTSSYS
ncbi:MAG: hypothetical protein ACPG4I_05555 [Candidatus Puniceispirillaceae bacterium]